MFYNMQICGYLSYNWYFDGANDSKYSDRDKDVWIKGGFPDQTLIDGGVAVGCGISYVFR